MIVKKPSNPVRRVTVWSIEASHDTVSPARVRLSFVQGLRVPFIDSQAHTSALKTPSELQK
eukprot:5315886-Amphidinium_carterae.1